MTRVNYHWKSLHLPGVYLNQLCILGQYSLATNNLVFCVDYFIQDTFVAIVFKRPKISDWTRRWPHG